MDKNGTRDGTAYRGRILMRWASINVESGITKVYNMPLTKPEFMISNPSTKTYTLRIDIWNGQQLPIESNQKGLLNIQIGPYSFATKAKPLQPSSNKIIWGERFEDKLLTLPNDYSNIFIFKKNRTNS